MKRFAGTTVLIINPIPVGRLYLFVIVLVLVFGGRRCTAQMDTATFAGRVFDSAGSSVAMAKVELIDTDRNTKSATLTNNIGFYLFPGIRPGHYRVQVSAPGFKTVNLRGLIIYTQDEIQELFILTAGSPLDSVTLQAAGVHVATSGTVGTVIEPALISDLPLNGLSFQTLFQLTPGTVVAPTSFASQGQFAVNGQRTNTNYFAVDGVSANVGIAAGINPGQSAVGSLPALTAFGSTNGLISTEDVQEFAILTSSYSAEFGHMPGAQVSIVSRSGTKEFHGNLFEYLRNDAFDANDWFANQAGLSRAALRQNDFGGVIGGPLYKDGTFLFGSVEGLELRQPMSSQDVVPSLASRNAAPTALKPFLNAYPLSNGPDEGNGLSQANYSFSNPSTLNAESLRLDHHRGESPKVFLRYVHSSSDNQQRGADSNTLSTVTDTHFVLQTLTAGITYAMTSKIINDFRLNWSESSASSTEQLDNFGGAVPLASQLVFPPGFNSKNGFFQFSPALSPNNITLAFGTNVENVQRQLNLLDNISYEVGTHLLKAGFDFRNLWPGIRPATYEQESVFSDVQSVLVGRSLVTAIAANVPVGASFRNYSAYVEDSWRPSAQLSLAFGGRWDYAPSISAKGSNGLRPFAVQGFDDLPTLSLASDVPLYRAPWNNFAPRVGFVYALRNSPGSQCVIRTGGGIFYDLSNGPGGNAVSGTFFPFTAQKFRLAASFPLTSLDASPPSVTANPPFSVIQAFPAVLKTPYTYQWNLSVEQAIGSSQTLSISAIGAVGRSLLRTEQYIGGEAGVPLEFTQVFLTDNAAYSNYNSLQIRFQRRAGTDIHLIASYAYSHSLDNVSTDAIFNGIPSRFADSRSDYGPSDFDIRQAATIGLNYSFQRGSGPHFLKILLSGWSIDSILTMRSSPPIDVTFSRDVGSSAYSLRPDLIPGVPLYVDDPNAAGGHRINPAALAVPTAQRQGDLARNFFRGFPLFQEDLAVGRDFHITGHVSIQARVEAFNVLNHPNFSPPLGQLGTVDTSGNFVPQSGFGISQGMLNQGLQGGSFGSGFSPLYQIGAARRGQLVLKITF